MGASNIRDFFNGFILVRIEGLNPEKFINMCSRNGIRLWDIKKLSYTVIEFKMKHSEFKYLKNIINKTSSRTRIIRKRGINFLFGKIKRRKFFALGVAVFLGILLYLSNLVWIIDISGNKKIDTNLIYESIKRAGIREGTLKQKINLRDVERNVLKNLNEISIININFIGTKAKVEIVERVMPPNLVPLDKPTNVVASRDGIILKMLSYKGQPLVQTGDYIKKSQILISGIITDSANVPTKIVHAMGMAIAKTWYESIQEVDINYKYETRTGRLKKKIYYNIMGKRICIKNDNIDFVKYDKIEEKNILKVAGRETPIEEITEYYYEKTENYKKLGYDEAVDIALKNAEESISKMLPENIKIIDKKIDKAVGNGKAKIRLLYVVEESIGVLQEIK
jgi:similar to stage IV sporulation protein